MHSEHRRVGLITQSNTVRSWRLFELKHRTDPEIEIRKVGLPVGYSLSLTKVVGFVHVLSNIKWSTNYVQKSKANQTGLIISIVEGRRGGGVNIFIVACRVVIVEKNRFVCAVDLQILQTWANSHVLRDKSNMFVPDRMFCCQSF